MSFIVSDDVVDSSSCSELLFLHNALAVNGYRPNVTSLTLTDVVMTYPEFLVPLVKARHSVWLAVEKALGMEFELYPEFTALIGWGPGASLGWHTDDNRDYLRQRDVSAVLYLNDGDGVDFHGGELTFRNARPQESDTQHDPQSDHDSQLKSRHHKASEHLIHSVGDHRHSPEMGIYVGEVASQCDDAANISLPERHDCMNSAGELTPTPAIHVLQPPTHMLQPACKHATVGADLGDPDSDASRHLKSSDLNDTYQNLKMHQNVKVQHSDQLPPLHRKRNASQAVGKHAAGGSTRFQTAASTLTQQAGDVAAPAPTFSGESTPLQNVKESSRTCDDTGLPLVDASLPTSSLSYQQTGDVQNVSAGTQSRPPVSVSRRNDKMFGMRHDCKDDQCKDIVDLLFSSESDDCCEEPENACIADCAAHGIANGVARLTTAALPVLEGQGSTCPAPVKRVQPSALQSRLRVSGTAPEAHTNAIAEGRLNAAEDGVNGCREGADLNLDSCGHAPDPALDCLPSQQSTIIDVGQQPDLKRRRADNHAADNLKQRIPQQNIGQAKQCQGQPTGPFVFTANAGLSARGNTQTVIRMQQNVDAAPSYPTQQHACMEAQQTLRIHNVPPLPHRDDDQPPVAEAHQGYQQAAVGDDEVQPAKPSQPLTAPQPVVYDNPNAVVVPKASHHSYQQAAVDHDQAQPAKSALLDTSSQPEGMNSDKPDAVVVPKAGRVVCFLATVQHAVREVIAGQRVTMTLWFTKNPADCEDRKIIEQLTRVMLSSGPRLGFPDTMYLSAAGQDIRLVRMALSLGTDVQTLTNIMQQGRQHPDASTPVCCLQHLLGQRSAPEGAVVQPPQLLVPGREPVDESLPKESLVIGDDTDHSHRDHECAHDVTAGELLDKNRSLRSAVVSHMKSNVGHCVTNIPVHVDVLEWIAGGHHVSDASLRCHFRTHVLSTDRDCRDDSVGMSKQWDEYKEHLRHVFHDEYLCWQDSGMLTPSL